MYNFLDIIGRGVNFLVQHEGLIWIFTMFVLVVYLIVNIIFSPYFGQNRLIKKGTKYLKRCNDTHMPVNANRITFPATLAQGFENYVRSEKRFPSELVLFKQAQNRFIGMFAAIAMLAVDFMMFVVGVKYAFMPFVLLMLFILFQGINLFVKWLQHRKAAKKVAEFAKQLDVAFGQGCCSKRQLKIDDVCMDKDVDEIVAKINFLKANGVNERTAKEVAALLATDKINKVRTHDQQKRLNLALNGLLQVLSKNQEKAVTAAT